MSESIQLSDDDLRELFALFGSPTEEEVAQIYSDSHRLFFTKEKLMRGTCSSGRNAVCDRRMVGGLLIFRATWVRSPQAKNLLNRTLVMWWPIRTLPKGSTVGWSIVRNLDSTDPTNDFAQQSRTEHAAFGIFAPSRDANCPGSRLTDAEGGS